MLRLSRLTDYAFAVLKHLADTPSGISSAREAAKATRLPLPTVTKVLKLLAQAGLVRSERGYAGGYRLAQRPDHIKLTDVIAALDGPIAITECSEDHPECGREATCALRPNWLRINASIRDALKGISLGELFRPLPRPRVSV